MSSTMHVLNVSSREVAGTSAVNRLRRTGQLPAVAYGRGKDPVNLSVDAHEFRVLLSHQGAGGLITLKFTDGKADLPVIVKEIQIDPRRNEVRTLDFLHVSLSEKVSSTALLVLEGEPIGVRQDGGLLTQSLHEIHISALPQNLPESITLDIAHLALNSSLHVKDITFPEGVESETDGEEIVASVAPPRAEKVETEEGAEGEAGAEDAEGEAPAKDSE
ncbi:MAG: 50S ribosomal protein L25 [Abditibacteriaceae bacterium]